MDNFKKSSDGRWYYGGYVNIDSEEYLMLSDMAKQANVPERIMAGIILRQALRGAMGTEDYIIHYRNRVTPAQSTDVGSDTSPQQSKEPRNPGDFFKKGFEEKEAANA